jgi:hypothetical protein
VTDPPLTNVQGVALGAAMNRALATQPVATFFDPGGADGDTSEYQASINWGDGSREDTATTIRSDGNGHFTVLGGAHAYARLGTFRAQVTIIHDHVNATTLDTVTVTAAASGR